MKLNALYKFILLLFFLTSLSAAISVSCSSGSSEGASSISSSYDLDSSTSLAQSTTLGDGWISSSRSLEGSGTNKIAQTIGDNEASVSSSISSIGALSSTSSSYTSRDAAHIGQNVQTIGQSESTISGASGSASVAQKAGVLDGAMASSQTASAQLGTTDALQAWNIAGTLGYSDGQAQSSDNIVKLTGGLNGVGCTSGFMNTIASGDASASGSLQANSDESKAYSAVKSTSADGNVYSYLSSTDQLTSSLSGTANGHVTSDQDLNANGDVLVHASSTSEDSSSKSYDAEGQSVSGSLSASSGSPTVIETNLAGDIQTSTSSLIPTPGSWVWNGLGGYITSNPYLLQAGSDTHIFAKGGDNGLWDNKNGNWYGLSGVITSDPTAAIDSLDKVHVLVKGSDNALWDDVLGSGWVCLGGYITSNPSAALSQDNKLMVVVKGGDNALWQKDLSTGSWSGMGGAIASNPQAILDKDGKMHVMVRGSDGALWDNVAGVWQSRGGIITSDAMPLVPDISESHLYTFVRGGDGSLWKNTLDTNTGTASWQNLGGYISFADGSNPYKGNPEPVMDSNGKVNVLVRGGDGALWNNINCNWFSLGGYITSNPSAINDPVSHLLKIAARGGDNALWLNSYKFYALNGLDFSPYLDGQDPNQHTLISEDQLRARMTLIAPYTQWIRTFGCTEGLENAGRIAHELGLKAALGAHLGTDLNDNEKQISNIINAAKAGYVDVAVVGNEAPSGLTDAQLISYINRVKSSAPGIKVAYGFTYNDLNRPAVISAVDIIYANIYPFYADPNGISIDQAISNMDWAYYQYAIPKAQGKQVIVSETGWPSSGSAYKGSIPSMDNAVRYFRDFTGWARNKNVPYFYFEAFDESWKISENPWEPYWGVWDKNGNLKPGMEQVFKA
jgi:exo-beta-1,3-glucanase (GH17 family)